MTFAGWDDCECALDIDPSRWLMVPRDDKQVDRVQFADRAAHAWASDTGNAGDRKWIDVLRQMIEHGSRAPYQQEPYLVFAYIRAPQGEAPFLQPATLRLLPDPRPVLDFARNCLTERAGSALEPPIHDIEQFADGTPAQVVAARERQADGSILSQIDVLWQAWTGALACVTTASCDLGQTYLMRDDLVGLAARIRFVHSTAPSG